MTKQTIVTQLSLPDFLLARIAEDEQTVADLRYTPRTHRDQLADASDPMYANLTRALREAEAKRRIVERTDPRAGMNAAFEPNPLVEWIHRQLALPYADHPDYNPDWRP